jgi:hydroxyacylglutathione hydrolase
MTTHIHPIPAFSDNYIWLFKDESSNNVCVVDPGEASPVIDYLTANDLNLTNILITHHHPDHTGGVKELRSKYQIAVYGRENSPFKDTDIKLKEGDEIEVFGLNFKVIEIPGHTLDHIAFFCDSGEESEQPILFCGDTLFASGCGRIFEGNPDMMYQSLQKLAGLDPTTRVYCGHEYTLANLAFAAAAEPDNPDIQNRIASAQDTREQDLPTLPSTISKELATNPFLRCQIEALQKAAESKTGSAINSPVETFATLRQWKDNF